MQCFICVTYMIFVCTAHPSNNRETSTHHVRRSLFHDVIESLRIRAQLPDDFNQNDENNLALNYDRYGYDNEPQLPSDADFIPRRNDRIEMPTLKHRFPKTLTNNDSFEDVSEKQEIVVYINTTQEPKTTQKPKKQRRTRPPANKIQINKYKDEEVVDESGSQKPDDNTWSNTLAGQSQIGNRDSQMILKPTVIVNIRGTVTHTDGEIRIEGRNKNETIPMLDTPQNVFNIKQEIKLERNFDGMGSNGGQKLVPHVVEEVEVISHRERQKVEEDMMMCETATWNPEKNREGRNHNSVMQILFAL